MVSAVSNLLGNTPLEQAMHDKLERLGPPPFDEADRALCREDPGDAVAPRTSPPPIAASACRCSQDVPLCDFIVPLDAKGAPMIGSTDVGDVSWVVPTVQARGATYAIGTPGPFLAAHRPGQDAGGPQGHGPRRQGDGRHRGGRPAGPGLIERAKADHAAR